MIIDLKFCLLVMQLMLAYAGRPTGHADAAHTHCTLLVQVPVGDCSVMRRGVRHLQTSIPPSPCPSSRANHGPLFPMPAPALLDSRFLLHLAILTTAFPTPAFHES
jgi:hypothetical protein